MSGRRGLIIVALLLLAGLGGYWIWQTQFADRLPEGIAKANGRIEAEQIIIATKAAGRIEEIMVDEGDWVQDGDVLARMDTAELKAQRRAAVAAINQAERHQAEAEALVAQRRSEVTVARKELQRAVTLNKKGYLAAGALDQRRNAANTAEAALEAAEAGVVVAEASIEAAKADLARIDTFIDDAVLIAPREGRVEYRLADEREVLGAGGRILTLVDLTDVEMTVFLPAQEAGRVAIGADARIVLDPAPDYVVPAKVTFVAPEAQFTPRQVETSSERENLMFRVKLRLPDELLRQYAKQVKTGVRGVAYIRTLEAAEFPPELEVNLP